MAITMLAVLMIMAAYHPLSDLYPPSALSSHGYARSFEVGGKKLAEMILKKTA